MTLYLCLPPLANSGIDVVRRAGDRRTVRRINTLDEALALATRWRPPTWSDWRVEPMAIYVADR